MKTPDYSKIVAGVVIESIGLVLLLTTVFGSSWIVGRVAWVTSQLPTARIVWIEVILGTILIVGIGLLIRAAVLLAGRICRTVRSLFV